MREMIKEIKRATLKVPERTQGNQKDQAMP